MPDVKGKYMISLKAYNIYKKCNYGKLFIHTVVTNKIRLLPGKNTIIKKLSYS